ncbi:MAG: putative aminoacrylate hydrolase RutD [Alphaproteobacteria bacterium ADurb.BinA280]|jgi:pimeloyl-ACP methyl ester carboxylesterase|nr:MAG: putative aminoacrylate hydrolase RutD [Alphaproteobacteria bacterium ADurb.BinA280]
MKQRWIFLMLSAVAGFAHASVKLEDGLQVEVRGEGRPVLFIPGLNSAASTWDASCEALRKDGVQCHLLQLPGFAGLAALPDQATQPFLPVMRSRVLAYIERAKLDRPAVVGHSLGGALALMLAIEAPDKIGDLVIVDSLPFFPAATNPAATSDMMLPMAEGMRTRMQAQTDEAYFQQAKAAASMGMSRDPARVAAIQQWGQDSARSATTQAMFELFTMDLRPQLDQVKARTRVLGAWAAYQPMGSTLESTRGIFEAQYATLQGVEIAMAPNAYHFIMFDDPEWLVEQVSAFLSTP